MGNKKLLSTIKDEKIIQVTKLGTNWNNGSNSRLFYLNVNNDSGNRNRNISGHLLNAFIMKQGNEQSLLLPVILLPCHLAKHKNSFELFW